MTKKIQIYGLTTSGKIKTIILEVKGDKLISTWGQLDGKMQTQPTTCLPTNEGRANERNGNEQACFEFDATVKKKCEQGYVTDPKLLTGKSTRNAEVELDNLPESFCPSKPISKCPQKVEDGQDTYAQRKLNGNCLILSKDGSEEVYSRTMKVLTPYLKDLPFIKSKLSQMKKGQMINNEVRFIYKNGKESTAMAGGLVRTQDAAEVMQKYKEGSKVGTFELWTFDILFNDYKFVGDLEYLNLQNFNDKNTRYGIINNQFDFVPEIILDWKKYVKYENGTPKAVGVAAKENWEGFVLRVPGNSAVTYTLNGKADRAGAWKFKYMKEGDFIVTAVEYGKGKFEDVYAVFSLSQYKDGAMIDCGNAGPGTLTYEELKEYTSEINSGKMRIPFVVEIEFRDWQEDSFKLEHPVIQRIRWDKTPEECIYE
jgi:hypothetical protein